MVYSVRYKDNKLIAYKHSSSGFVISVLGKYVSIKSYEVLLLNFKKFFKVVSSGAELKLNRDLIRLFLVKLGLKF